MSPTAKLLHFHWIESYLTFKRVGLDGQCCQLYNHVSFYLPNVYAVLLLEFMIFSKAMYSTTCTFKSDPCHAAILVCSLVISVSSHFHSISMSYNFSLSCVFPSLDNLPNQAAGELPSVHDLHSMED